MTSLLLRPHHDDGRCEPVLIPVMVRQDIVLCGLIGACDVCGKVTGWRSLTMNSLMLTHPVTIPPISYGRAFHDKQQMIRSEVRACHQGVSRLGHHVWCVARIVSSTH